MSGRDFFEILGCNSVNEDLARQIFGYLNGEDKYFLLFLNKKTARLRNFLLQDFKNDQFKSITYYAAKNGYLRLLKYAHVDRKMPLIGEITLVAIEYDREPCMKYLIENAHKPYRNLCNVAATHNSITCLQTLVGMNLPKTRSAHEHAIENDYVEILEILYHYNFLTPKLFAHAVTQAATKGKPKCLRFLLRYEITKTVPKIWDLAFESGNIGCIDLAIKRDGFTPSMILKAIVVGYIDILYHLLPFYKKEGLPKECFKNAIFHSKNRFEVVKWLVENNAPRSGTECLDAATVRDFSVVDFLIKSGFDINFDIFSLIWLIEDNKTKTSLVQWAVDNRFPQTGHECEAAVIQGIECLKPLVEGGYFRDIRACKRAIEIGNSEILDYLLSNEFPRDASLSALASGLSRLECSRVLFKHNCPIGEIERVFELPESNFDANSIFPWDYLWKFSESEIQKKAKIEIDFLK